ncbi:maleylpyruvate isomerase family mycothiol-dependent enzyme [Euzebya tangerina]|uniref:maleylpyruvate isomerase family mycothiol-dependent enzyme n=1 Tax=Euzebya tangerina TaxID=591198 RepID=UPI000E3187A0|nr:maleylpyruvate isomerase family mycothiol-dependent enzyme [Euzebya tangerina]
MNYRTHTAQATTLFLELARDGDLSTPVGSCPGWTVADLVGHLGTVQRFHGANLLRGVTTPPTDPRPTPPDAELIEWAQASLDILLANLDQVGDDRPAWNFLGQPPTTAFWHRRMALEATMHRWDMQQARGVDLGLDHALAVDGIDEVLTAFVPGRRRGDEPEGTVTVTLTDNDHTWTVTNGDGDAARAAVTGPAEQVWLRLWGRVPLDAVEVVGDRDLAAAMDAGR